MATPDPQTISTPMRGCVALLDVDVPLENTLRERLGTSYEFKIFDGHEPLVSALDLGTISVDALIIGAESENRVETALAARKVLRHLQVILVADLREVSGLERRAAIQSEDVDGIEVWARQNLDDLPKALKRAIKRAHRRVTADRGSGNGDSDQDAGPSCVTEYLDKLLEHAPIGMLTIDFDYKVVALNKRARLLLGARRSQLINHSLLEFFAPVERRRLRRVLNSEPATETVGQGDVLRLEVALEPGETEIRHLEVIVAGPVTRQGEECTMVILHDVSGIVRAQLAERRTAAALQASEDRFNELAEVMRMVPWEADPRSLEITFIGRLVEEVMGFERGDWLGRSFWIRRLHPDDRERAIRTISRNSRRLQNFDFEFRMVARDGSIKWLRNIVNVVRTSDGEIQKIRGFIVDITERKSAAIANGQG